MEALLVGFNSILFQSFISDFSLVILFYLGIQGRAQWSILLLSLENIALIFISVIFTGTLSQNSFGKS